MEKKSRWGQLPSPELAPTIRPKDRERFWRKVHVREEDACWPWLGHRLPKGYGHFKVDGRKHGAHRLAYLIATGQWPPIVMHTCDTPPCCNYAHLRAANGHAENVADRVRKGRSSQGEKARQAQLRRLGRAA